MKLTLCRKESSPFGPAMSSATPVPKRATVVKTTPGASSRRAILRRSLLHVGGSAEVVAGEAVAGAGELRRHRAEQEHADQDVRLAQLTDEGDRRPLDREQDQEQRAEGGGEAAVAGYAVLARLDEGAFLGLEHPAIFGAAATCSLSVA